MGCYSRVVAKIHSTVSSGLGGVMSWSRLRHIVAYFIYSSFPDEHRAELHSANGPSSNGSSEVDKETVSPVPLWPSHKQALIHLN